MAPRLREHSAQPAAVALLGMHASNGMGLAPPLAYAVKKGSVRWAPWIDGGAFRVRTTGAIGKWNCVLVRWMEGPFKGTESTLDARTLKSHRRDAVEKEDWSDLE